MPTGYAVRTARLFFDGGANISLITNHLAITLKAKRIQSYKEISEFGGNRVSNHAVEIELSSAYEIRGRHVRVRCQVVDDIYRSGFVKNCRDVIPQEQAAG